MGLSPIGGGFNYIPSGSVTPADLSFDTIEKVTETTLGAAATSIAFTGLDLTTDRKYIIEFMLLSAGAGANTVSLFFNADTTTTNYQTQLVEGNAGAANASRTNSAAIGHIPNSEYTYIKVEITQITGQYPMCTITESRGAGASNLVAVKNCQWVGTAANITTITLTGAVASGIGTTSKAMLFRVS